MMQSERRKPSRPGQTVRGRDVVPHLDTGELVLLELLYRLAARGAAAEGNAALAVELSIDRASLGFALSQRARRAMEAREARDLAATGLRVLPRGAVH